MRRRLKVSTMEVRARHVRRHSHTVGRMRLHVTLGILAVLLAALCVYAFTQYSRIHTAKEGVEVIVGSTLMARVELTSEGEEVPVLDALRAVSVRPTTRQVIVFQGEDMEFSLTAEEADGYFLTQAADGLYLQDETGSSLGQVHTILLPTDEDAVKQLP